MMHTRHPTPKPTDPSYWALFLDIDGTLLDIADSPGAVIIPADLPPLLDSLNERLQGALALISGRSLADIDTLFPGGSLFPGGRDAAGSHGAEMRMPGMRVIYGENRLRDLAEVVGMIDQQARFLKGVTVEHKPRSVALHFRRAPDQADAVVSLARQVIAGARSPFRLLQGKGIVEVIPDGIDKGRAIDQFMRYAPYEGRVPVFVGDDVTDENGFQAVNQRGGLSIHVGQGPTVAHYRLPSSSAVRAWLTNLDTMNRLTEGLIANEHS